MYIVKPNRRYTILEKPDATTPPELKLLGKAKMGGNHLGEPTGCPWDDVRNRYETGLNRNSREFIGKDKKEVDKILEDRKDLVNYLNDIVAASGKTENEFLETYLLELNHNKIVDTSNIDNYLRLFLAMRGTLLTPEDEVGNIAKYGMSMYMLRDSQETFNAKEEVRIKKDKVKEWFYTMYKKDEEQVLNVLRYEGILGYKQVKSKAILSDLIERKIQDINVLDNLLFTIEKTPYNDIVISNTVHDKIKQKLIKKEGGQYIYNSTPLGSSIKNVVNFLKNTDNIEIATKILD